MVSALNWNRCTSFSGSTNNLRACPGPYLHCHKPRTDSTLRDFIYPGKPSDRTRIPEPRKRVVDDRCSSWARGTGMMFNEPWSDTRVSILDRCVYNDPWNQPSEGRTITPIERRARRPVYFFKRIGCVLFNTSPSLGKQAGLAAR